MPIEELSLAVVGLPYPNADGSSRIDELKLCKPGDPVELRPEPDNPHDGLAIAVFSERGVQLGYLTAERAPWIGSRLAAGEFAITIFQEVLETAAVIRLRFGGEDPALPRRRPRPVQEPRRTPTARRPVQDFYPDPDGPEWGA